MSSVKSTDTKLEEEFRKELWSTGLRYRKNPKGYYGKPDLVFKNKKIVVCIDSCFWHGCKTHLRLPKSNRKYWVSKIERNKKRDRVVNKHYKKIGWEIIRVWEHDILKDIKKSAKRVAQLI